ncbi:hypothetical protein R1sor_013917 [Riccia sorocarpa]|uniref:Uncharacterized protein n=1 Tax=Riccia sorocarpa TaxID=122646 RepID=A0ABD3H8I3_9MARC
MAHEVHDGSPHREPGYGGNAEGVIGEHQQRPGMGGKVKNTLAHVTAKLMGQKGEQERASNFPGAKFNEDPHMYIHRYIFARSFTKIFKLSGPSERTKGLHEESPAIHNVRERLLIDI